MKDIAQNPDPKSEEGLIHCIQLAEIHQLHPVRPHAVIAMASKLDPDTVFAYCAARTRVVGVGVESISGGGLLVHRLAGVQCLLLQPFGDHGDQ